MSSEKLTITNDGSLNENLIKYLPFYNEVHPRVLRVIEYFKSRKKIKKICEATRIQETVIANDPRPHISLKIGDKQIVGLLDSGASISILGNNCLEILQDAELSYKPMELFVETADGTQNSILGFLDIPIDYINQTKTIRFYLVPSLKGTMYLGNDFWSAFGLYPAQINEIKQPASENSNKHQLNSQQQEELDSVIKLFPSYATLGLGKTHLVEHTIETGDAKPVKQRHYPVSPAIQDLMYKEIDRMLKLKVIEECNSPWSSPVVLIRKPGKVRLCIDLRKVNAVTEKNAYPLPLIDGLLGRLSATKFITSLDLKDAFWQIPLAEASRGKTAFTVPGRPLYRFTVMPFGACNAPQTMCELMHKVIPYQWHDRVFVYMDDLLITSETYEEHVRLLRMVADRLNFAGLSINIEKSHFIMKEIRYLGFIVGERGLRVDPEKVAAINNFPSPSSVRQARRLLGMAGWYHRFMANFAEVAAPIFNVLKKGVKFSWNEEAEEAFNKIKTLLTTSPVLITPNYSKPFYIRCDASTEGVGGVLFQKSEEGDEHPIAYVSKKLNETQKKYTITELECLAALVSIKKFRPYVEGQDFTLITDHASLKWLMSQKDLHGRLARWSLKLQGYDFKITHQKGKENIVPDALSRIYCDEVNELELDVAMTLDTLDLKSVNFEDLDYRKLRDKIASEPDKFTRLKIVDNRVYVRNEPKKHQSLGDVPLWKLWVPNSLTKQILETEHNLPTASHGGIKKTLDRIRRLYHWPTMSKDIYEYVSQCQTCKETKFPNSTLRPNMHLTEFPKRPWQKIFVDFLGPYPRSKDGHTVIFIVVDHLTKFVLLKSMASGTARNIVKYLSNEVFQLFGVPEKILSDNGVQFVGLEFKKMMEEYGIEHIRTALYSPQANASERVNRSIIAAIRAYVKVNHREWSTYLGEIGNALRNSIHESTRYAPHFLMFGLNKINHGSTYALLRDLDSLSDPEFEILPPDVRLPIFHDQVRQYLKESQEKNMHRYNLRTRNRVFQPGETVYYRTHPQSDAVKGISAKFVNPFQRAIVHSREGNVNYILKDTMGKIIGTFHGKDLKC